MSHQKSKGRWPGRIRLLAETWPLLASVSEAIKQPPEATIHIALGLLGISTMNPIARRLIKKRDRLKKSEPESMKTILDRAMKGDPHDD